MPNRNKINDILRKLEKDNPGFVDKLNDKSVNEIRELQSLLKGFKITNFFVKRDNKTIPLEDGTARNIGRNKLIGFSYNLIFV